MPWAGFRSRSAFWRHWGCFGTETAPVPPEGRARSETRPWHRPASGSHPDHRNAVQDSGIAWARPLRNSGIPAGLVFWYSGAEVFGVVFMDLFFREAADRIGDEDVLSKIDALLDWRAFSPIVTRGLGRSGIGPQGYDPLVL